MNPSVGDGDRLCNAGPHNSAEFPRGLVSTDPRGIGALDQTPSSLSILLTPHPPPPTLIMAAFEGHTVTIFITIALLAHSVC